MQVFQRRENDQTDFYQEWDTYRFGFGDVSGPNFWLGTVLGLHILLYVERAGFMLNWTSRSFYHAATGSLA